MFSCHTNSVKMKVNKLLLSYSMVVKLQPLHNTRKTFITGIQLQNFSTSSCFFNETNINSASSISVTGVEQINSVPRISKRKNKLSKVEEKDFEIVENLKKGINIKGEAFGEMAKKVVKNEAKILGGKAVYLLSGVDPKISYTKFFKNHTDVLIIGGGAVGLSIAYSIRNQFPHGPQVTVVDKDNSFPHLSTNLGQGLVSSQLFNEEQEIPILKYGIDFFSAFSKNMEMPSFNKFKLEYDPLGSLLLVDENNAAQVLKNHETLKTFGLHTKMLDKNTLQRMFPWLNTENTLFASLGMFGEGIIDPWMYIYALKCKCINLGVNFEVGEVVDFGYENNMIRRAVCKLPDGSYNFIDFCYCVLAGGLETLNIVNLFNESEEYELFLKLPLEERMRHEYCFYSANGPGLNTPIIFNPDGTYFRREGLGGHYVAGVPSVVYNDNEDDDDAGERKSFEVFESTVKPFLIKRFPNMNKIDLVKCWIDAYDYCISNKVGITGPHPSTQKIIFALGFSHLGLQYLPALGRGIMEYLFYRDYQTIDFTVFHIENLWRKQHLEADERRRELLEAEKRVSLSE